MRNSKVPETHSWFSSLRWLWDRPWWLFALAVTLLLVGLAITSSSPGPSAPTARSSERADRDLASRSVTRRPSASSRTPDAAKNRATPETARRDGVREDAQAIPPRVSNEERAALLERRAERRAALRELRAEKLESRRRERSRSRSVTTPTRESAPYVPLDFGFAESDAVQGEGDTVKDEADAGPHIHPRDNLLLRAGGWARAGNCERALSLYSRILIETEDDLLPTESFSLCIPDLIANPGANPELAEFLGVNE